MGTLGGSVNVLLLIAVRIFVGVYAQLTGLPRVPRSHDCIYYIKSFLSKLDKENNFWREREK